MYFLSFKDLVGFVNKGYFVQKGILICALQESFSWWKSKHEKTPKIHKNKKMSLEKILSNLV